MYLYIVVLSEKNASTAQHGDKQQETRNKELTHECPPKHPSTGIPRIRQGKEIKEDTQESTYSEEKIQEKSIMGTKFKALRRSTTALAHDPRLLNIHGLLNIHNVQ